MADRRGREVRSDENADRIGDGRMSMLLSPAQGPYGQLVGCYRLDPECPAEEGAPLDHERVRTLLEDRREPPSHRHPDTLRGPNGGYRGPRGGYKDSGGLIAWLSSQTAVGGRNSALYWAACRALEHGEDPNALADTALELGLEPEEVERTINSAWRTGEALSPGLGRWSTRLFEYPKSPAVVRPQRHERKVNP